MEVECEGFTFTSNFDSGNLERVEFVPKCKTVEAPKGSSAEQPEYEFNLWTKPDCGHTEFENGNRTWFYFGVKGGPPFALVKLNIMNMNRQQKMFSEGMSPVFKVVPGRPQWDRIHDKPTYMVEQKRFVVSFKFRTVENINATTFFAFTYPFSYTEVQNQLKQVDAKCQKFPILFQQTKDPNTIYYHRECVVKSIEHRKVDLVTISSYHGISDQLEPRLRHLFPETETPRPHMFPGKKVVFVSARVHPGETQSTFVLNGMLNFLLQPLDPVAQMLRKQFVFKFVPMLNPDGVANGHYRTDTRGVNLNRVYLNPSLILHPSIFAARSLIRYHHYGCEMDEEKNWDNKLDTVSESPSPELLVGCSNSEVCPEESDGSCSEGSPIVTLKERLFSKADDVAKLDEDARTTDFFSTDRLSQMNIKDENSREISADQHKTDIAPSSPSSPTQQKEKKDDVEPTESGIFIYLDLHGHASKKGVFMYGNHFENIDDSIETFLMPKLMSMNNPHFHFTSCNFSKRNMYLRDRRDGMSREGSGRVAVYKLTGLVRCYTLECNYNTGRLVNTLPSKDTPPSKTSAAPIVPPKYNPPLFEEVGKAMAVSVLDLTGSNPSSRIRHSELRNLAGIKDWLRRYVQTDLSISRAQRKPPFQVTTTTGGSSSSSGCGPSSLPSLVESGRKKGKKVDLKENLASCSHALDPLVKLKNPMSPKENILQAPSFSKTSSKKVGKVEGGRVTKKKPSLDKKEAGSSSSQVLKQGPKRLRICPSGPPLQQEVQLERSLQVLASKPEATVWGINPSPTSSKVKAEVKGAVGKVRVANLSRGLSPIKKGGTLTRKKSFEWEKKKNKIIKTKKLAVQSEESLENAPF